MIKHRPQHIRHAIRAIILQMSFLAVLPHHTNRLYAQDEELNMLEAEEILQFRYELYPQSIGLFFAYIPPDLLHRRLLITNARTSCLVGYEINAITIEHRQALVELCNDWHRSDTFFIALQEDDAGLNYIPQKIIPGVSSAEVKLGANCYKLLCEPKNDPWMPNANKPFLFSRDDYYVNPKNGNAKSGERLLHSGHYSACELENWELVYADDMDIYKAHLKTKQRKKKKT